ncbi:DUF6247 family protein [Streptomyces sp. NBC_00145]
MTGALAGGAYASPGPERRDLAWSGALRGNRAASADRSRRPACEQDWVRALDDARHSYSLAPVNDVVRAWRARLASAPAVDAVGREK